MSTIRTYSELITIPTFEERFKYCQCQNGVSYETFGAHRYLNQRFYNSLEWRKIRREIIVRDNACDLATPGYDIGGQIYIHHLNPMKIQDLVDKKSWVLLPEYLVCTSFSTHQALHYGSDVPNKKVVERRANDTAPWLLEA